jgi:gliding motility-associated-like protein
VSGPIVYCQNGTAQAITATPSNVGNTVNYWGTNASGGISSSTPITPLTTTAGTTTYYFSESNGACESSRTSVNVVVNALPSPPSTTDSIVYCQNQVATALTPNGTSFLWYTTPSGGIGTTIAPVPSTIVTGVTTYYVSQTQNNCESNRDSVKVIVNTGFSAPAASGATYCQNASASSLLPNGTGYNWYLASTGGTPQSSVIPTTSIIGTITYYVSQGNASCESPRTPVQVSVVAPPSGPQVSGPIVYCQNEIAQVITATPSNVGNTVNYWGTNASGGTSSSTPITPLTTTAGTTTYYFSESNGTCESNRTSVDVVVNALPSTPSTTDTIAYCQNQVAIALTPNGTSFLWYTTSSGGAGTTTAPVPSTVSTGVTTYYVSQTINNCESNRDSVKVVVNTSFNAPVALNDTNCIGSTATVLTPNGTGYNWYTSASGGIANTSITPSTATTGTVSYYVSQGSGTCESPRTQVDVITLALPSSPSLTGSLDICSGNSTTLTVTNPTETYNWYTTASGGTTFLSANTFTTPILYDTTSYYVETFNGQCSSIRNLVRVNVNPIPTAPTTTDTISYCLNESAIALSPNGTNYIWYTSSSGGVGTTTAPVPSTIASGVTTYYVSQILNNCESNRDSVKIIVSTGFSAPTASGVTYCQNATAQILLPNGTGYNWYTTSIGGTAQPIITPSTTNVGTTTYFVSQGNGSCESPRTAVDVVVNAIPNQPIVTDVNYCINETPGSLIVNSTGSLTWYNQGSGGVGFTTTPSVNTSSVGIYNFYVSQTINGCESSRDTLTVTVIDLQNPPTTQSVSYCKNDVALSLSATSTSNLNWWGTNASGGTSTGTAPIPNTTTAGTTIYYVSQGTGACESPRVSLAVTVNDLPIVSFTQSATSICNGKCILFNAQTSSNCTNLIWNFGNGTSSNNSSETICFNNAGSYDVSLSCTDANTCSNNSVVQNAVIVGETPVADFSISPGNIVSPGSNVVFNAQTSTVNGINYGWYFDDPSSGNLNTSSGSNANHVYNNTGNYCIVLVASLSNCSDTISKCIDVLSDPQITIPNLFTPNGDGINDLFLVSAEGITLFQIQFFDRWGNSVFNSKSIDVSWDGKNNGKKVSDGVYYYIVTYTDFKSQTKTLSGFVSLIGN